MAREPGAMALAEIDNDDTQIRRRTIQVLETRLDTNERLLREVLSRGPVSSEEKREASASREMLSIQVLERIGLVGSLSLDDGPPPGSYRQRCRPSSIRVNPQCLGSKEPQSPTEPVLFGSTELVEEPGRS
jgi:hypothetical protein